jgi:hypothetical protein
MQKMNFKASIEPESLQTSNARSLRNALILRNLLVGVSERSVKMNGKEVSHPAKAS